MSIQLRPSDDMTVSKIRIGRMPALVVRPKRPAPNPPGVLWIHGGGYIIGMKEMVYMSRAMDLVRDFGAVVVAPGYRLAVLHPYPAAIDDCTAALLYLREHAADLGFRSDQIMVGGESAGGGLAAAVCIRARDEGKVNIAFQMPLYPMLSNLDTESSRDNHGKMWNTKLNHLGWKLYLRDDAKREVSPHASASRETDYSGLPPCYTFVGDGEPFYRETLDYVAALAQAGVPAAVDVYHTDVHGFDMISPNKDISVAARAAFRAQCAFAVEHYFAENG